MNGSPFASPSEVQSGVSVNNLEGALIVLQATGPAATTMTVNGESQYTPARVLVVTPTSAEQNDLVGEFHDLWIFPKVLQGMLRNAGERPIVGVVGKGAAKPGQSAPWILADTDAAGLEKAAGAYRKAEAPTVAPASSVAPAPAAGAWGASTDKPPF